MQRNSSEVTSVHHGTTIRCKHTLFPCIYRQNIHRIIVNQANHLCETLPFNVRDTLQSFLKSWCNCKKGKLTQVLNHLVLLFNWLLLINNISNQDLLLNRASVYFPLLQLRQVIPPCMTSIYRIHSFSVLHWSWQRY